MEEEIPSSIPIWLIPPYLPLNPWEDKIIEEIGNAREICWKTWAKARVVYLTQICVKVNLEEGPPKKIELQTHNFGPMCKHWTIIRFHSNVIVSMNMIISRRTARRSLPTPQRKKISSKNCPNPLKQKEAIGYFTS